MLEFCRVDTHKTLVERLDIQLQIEDYRKDLINTLRQLLAYKDELIDQQNHLIKELKKEA